MRGLRGKRVLVSGGSSGIGAGGGAAVPRGGLPRLHRRAGRGRGRAAAVAASATSARRAVTGVRRQPARTSRGCGRRAAARAGRDRRPRQQRRHRLARAVPGDHARALGPHHRGQPARHVPRRRRRSPRHMVEQGGGGVIVNMSSTNGLAGEADYAHYNASKGGVLLLTKTMAVELGPHGIRVNALCPGYIDTAAEPRDRSRLGSDDFAEDYARDSDPARPRRACRGGRRGLRVPGLRRRLVHVGHRPRRRRRPAGRDVTASCKKPDLPTAAQDGYSRASHRTEEQDP